MFNDSWAGRNPTRVVVPIEEEDKGEWSAPRPGRLTPEERTHSTELTGDWENPRTGVRKELGARLHNMVDINLLPLPGIEPKHWIVGSQPDSIPTTPSQPLTTEIKAR
jgi:hypothetical protein